jgi:tetratricopeptide (TPR) repeat protein
MKAALFLLVFFLIVSAVGYGQTRPSYDTLMARGDSLFKAGKYRKAYKTYKEAKSYFKENRNAIDKKIDELFDAIDRDLAVSTKQKDSLKIVLGDLETQKQINEDEGSRILYDARIITEMGNGKTPDSSIIKEARRIMSLKSLKEVYTSVSIRQSSVTTQSAVYFNPIPDSSVESAVGASKAFIQYSTGINGILSKKAKIPEDLLASYLKAVLYHSWNLMDEKKLRQAKEVLDQGEKLASGNTYRSGQICFAIAGLYNARSRYMEIVQNGPLSLKYAQEAINFSRKAVQADGDKIPYQVRLSVYLRNVVYVPDSVLSKENKDRYVAEGCHLAYDITGSSAAGKNALATVVTCAGDEADGLTRRQEYDSALNVLAAVAARFDSIAPIYNDNTIVNLNRASIYMKMESIERYNKTNKTVALSYLKKAIADWSRTIQSKELLSPDLELLTSVYKDITGQVNELEPEDEKLKVYIVFFTEIGAANSFYGKYPSFEYLAAKNYNNYISLLTDGKDTYDTSRVIAIASKCLDAYHQTKITDDYSTFKEDYGVVCAMYLTRLQLYIGRDNFDLAQNDYQKLIAIFKPIYKKYPFDFYLERPIVGASSAFGAYLYQKGKYAEAIAPLEFGSEKGVKQSTGYLMKIFNGDKHGLKDTTRLGHFSRLIKMQSGIMKRFTIPCDFAGTTAPFNFYVVDRDKNFPYKGIDDQAEWLSQARGGKVAPAVLESFRRLQRIAWENGVSFADLCQYAVSQADEKTTLEKYQPFKEKIRNAPDTAQLNTAYQFLYDMYDADLKNDTANKVILKDAISFYWGYALYLSDNGKAAAAVPVYTKILALGHDRRVALDSLYTAAFRKYGWTTDSALRSDDTTVLEAYFTFCLDRNDQKGAGMIRDKILSSRDSPLVRDRLSQIYLLHTGDGHFRDLFLDDRKRSKEYGDYFRQKNVEDDPLVLKRLHYSRLVLLDEGWLRSDSSDSVKRTAAQEYNSVGWYSLLTGQYSTAYFYFLRSLRLDSNYVYPLENLPHSYLFMGQYEKAKSLYLQYKDLPFDRESRFHTYKDAFLDDFKEFEKEGITNEHIKEIIGLLSQ